MHQRAILACGALLAALLLALVFTLGYVSNEGGGGATSEAASNSNQNGELDFGTLNEIVDILKREYISNDELDEEALYEAAINGLVQSLSDTGTFYVDPASFQLSYGPSGSFEGIGATVQRNDSNEIVIVRPFAKSPAEQAGLQTGDVILAVDSEPTAGWSVDKAALRIRGPRGSEVTLSIRFASDGRQEDVTLVRDEIQVESVSTAPPGGVLKDAQGAEVTDFGYMHILQFTERTPQEVAAIIADYQDQGKHGLIIDLRENPGGLLQETVDTADMFLDDGTILIEVDRNEQQFAHRANPGGPAVDLPVVVLMDEYSASGSEVLASALRDNGRATIIGEKSFGKGTVNVSQQLENGGALFVTIRRWLTPAGVQIDGVGITPDIEVTPGPFDPQYDELQDGQLFRAIDQLRSTAATQQPATSPTGQ